MITTLLFDFSWVLAFPNTTLSNSSSQAFEYAQQHQQSWKKYLALNDELIDFVTRETSHFQNYIFSASSPQILHEIQQHLVPPFKQVLSSKELMIIFLTLRQLEQQDLKQLSLSLMQIFL